MKLSKKAIKRLEVTKKDGMVKFSWPVAGRSGEYWVTRKCTAYLLECFGITDFQADTRWANWVHR